MRRLWTTETGSAPSSLGLALPWCVGTRQGLSAHLGYTGDQAPEAKQGLRHGFHIGAHLLMCALVGDKSTDHTNPVMSKARGKQLAGCPGSPGGQQGPALLPGPLQQHEGGKQQEGHERATLAGHGLVLRLHSASAALVAATTAEAQAGGGHRQEVEARDHSTHHIARFVPNHLVGSRV